MSIDSKVLFRCPGRIIVTVTAICGALVLSGCRQDMHDQPKYKPLGQTHLFEDGRMSRPLVRGVVARGELNTDEAFYQGKAAGQPIDYFPIPVTKELIKRGQDRFEIYCSPCHGRLGNGLGMIVRRGMKQPPSYHIDRLRTSPAGYFYDVITNGYGAMLNYSAQVEPHDRWAIVAYIRVLQFSQNASFNDLPAASRAKIPAASTVNPEGLVPARRERDVVNPEQQMIPQNKPVPTARPGAE